MQLIFRLMQYRQSHEYIYVIIMSLKNTIYRVRYLVSKKICKYIVESILGTTPY